MRTVSSASRSPPPRPFIALLILSVLLGLAAAIPFAAIRFAHQEFYSFAVDLTADHPGTTQVFFDVGRGINEADSSSQPLKITSETTRYRYFLPLGRLKLLRFDFNNTEGVYTFSRAKILSHTGRVLYEFSPQDFHADSQIANLQIADEIVKVSTVSRADDPYIYLRLSHPLDLEYGWREAIASVDRVFTIVFLAVLLGGIFLEKFGAIGPDFFDGLKTAAREKPKLTLAFLAAVSVATQVHPIIFSGKSFASPNSPTFLLYDRFPTLPGYSSNQVEDQKESDVGAFAYQHMLFPSLQRKALWEDHEWPLWNRYNLGGVPLLGQGQTMFGEILNFLPMLANSAAWAWDIKFILSRWLFAFGSALFVWRATRNLSAAAIIAATVAWIGYFAFRINHPSQFAVCFGPLILVGWTLLESARDRRSLSWAAFFLFSANWEVMTSGTIKEAYMMIPCVNLAGLLYLLARTSHIHLVRLQVGAALLAGTLLALISAPIWWIFLDTLKVSSTSYDLPFASQIPGWEFIGFFEDMFYRRLNPHEVHGNPSVNLIVLFGSAWLFGSLLFGKNRVNFAMVLSAIIPASLAFGVIPGSWLLKVPFLANIYHVGNTFSCALIVISIALAGLGLADFIPTLKNKVPLPALLIALGLLVLFLFKYGEHTLGADRSRFFTGYIASLALTAFTFATAILCRRRMHTFVLYYIVALCVVLVLWRHGQYNHIPFDEYVFNPQVRVDLHAPSPAIEKIAELEKEPARIAGFSMNLYTGANVLYFQEGIYGVEAVRNGYFDELGLAVGLPKVRYWGTANYGGERTYSRGALDMLNVRYYLDSLNANELVEGLELVSQKDLKVYESTTVWPRAFFTNNLIEEGDLENLSKLLHDAKGTPFAALTDAESAQMKKLNVYKSPSDRVLITPARNYKLTSNITTFTVDADSPGVIVLSETFYPKDFIVSLNDKPVEYFRVNHAFKGIAVESSGTYQVKFEYWPHDFTKALVLSSFGIALGVIILIAFNRRSKSLLRIAP